MNAPEGAKERLISNYCEELEKTLEDVHCNIARKINIAQRRQKKGYDDRNRVDETLALEPEATVCGSTIQQWGRDYPGSFTTNG